MIGKEKTQLSTFSRSKSTQKPEEPKIPYHETHRLAVS
jgi:hypothetical protein